MDPGKVEKFGDTAIRQNRTVGFAIDQLANAVTHRLRRMRLTAGTARQAGGKEKLIS